ncbi:MAG: hypothetical protein HY902_18065 [Deltaproteobacteria bacterium]|nr:hypothetical protein [Deltaproteobacteria bacterium]
MRKLVWMVLVPALGTLWAAPLLAMTLAVSYFDNRSGQDQWQPLSKGLADMLITDLAETDGVTVVERERLQAVLGEIQLGKGKFIDPATAQKLGKGLGATHVMTGSYQLSGNKVRIDARAIEVATGAVRVTAEHTGPADDVFAVESKLAEKLREGLTLKRRGEAKKPTKVSADEVRTYGLGLEAIDDGHMDEARRILGALAMQRPDFAQVQRGLEQLSRRIKTLLDQSKYAPEKIVALAGQIEAGKLDACGPLMNELMQLQGAATRAAVTILNPASGDRAEVQKTLAAFYAVTLLLLDKPPLSQPICPGAQSPAATSLSLFLFTMHMPAKQVMDCHPLMLAQAPNPKQRQDQCDRVLKRVPDLADAQGRVLVAAADYPALMVQLGQVMIERFPNSAYLQSLLPIVQSYVEFLKVTALSGPARQQAIDRGIVDKARQQVAQATAYADMYLAILQIPQQPALRASIAPGTARLTLGLSEGDITMGTARIELSVDGGKTWPHRWPLKGEAPGAASASVKLAVAPGSKLLVGLAERLRRDGTPEFDHVARWYQTAVWLGTESTAATVGNAMFRLVALDDSELVRCPVQHDAETSDRTEGAWLFAKAMCKAP